MVTKEAEVEERGQEEGQEGGASSMVVLGGVGIVSGIVGGGSSIIGISINGIEGIGNG